MPVEQADGANRAPVTHLEALGRLLAGLAPWLALPAARHRRGPGPCAPRSISPGGRSRRRSIRPRPTRSTSPPIASRWSTPRSWRTRSLRAPAALGDGARRRDAQRGSSPRSTSTRVITPGVQQLAAVLGDGRSGPGAARRAVGSDARRLRAAAARAVVQRRRPLRRRAGRSTGTTTTASSSSRCCWTCSTPSAPTRAERTGVGGDAGAGAGPRPALRRRPGAPDRAGRHVPGDRPVDRLSLRRLPAAGADRAPARAARRRRRRARSAPRCRP